MYAGLLNVAVKRRDGDVQFGN